MKNFILLCLLLGACGDDQSIVGDDDQAVTADADPAAPDARADADPAAPDADPVAPDAGPEVADAAAPGCTAADFPCWYDCDGFTGLGCSTGGNCQYVYDSTQLGGADGGTYCDTAGNIQPGERCGEGAILNDCVPGSLCKTASNDGVNRCHEQCVNSSPGCLCLVYDDHTVNGEIIRYCQY